MVEETKRGRPAKAQEEGDSSPSMQELLSVVSSLADSVTAINSKIEAVAERVEKQRAEPQRMQTWQKPNLKELKPGQMHERNEVHVPRFVSPPKFGEGEIVQVDPDSEKGRRLAAAGKDATLGWIYGVPKSLNKHGQWKYRVQFEEGVGRDGVLECDLIPAQV